MDWIWAVEIRGPDYLSCSSVESNLGLRSHTWQLLHPPKAFRKTARSLCFNGVSPHPVAKTNVNCDHHPMKENNWLLVSTTHRESSTMIVDHYPKTNRTPNKKWLYPQVITCGNGKSAINKLFSHGRIPFIVDSPASHIGLEGTPPIWRQGAASSGVGPKLEGGFPLGLGAVDLGAASRSPPKSTERVTEELAECHKCIKLKLRTSASRLLHSLTFISTLSPSLLLSVWPTTSTTMYHQVSLQASSGLQGGSPHMKPWNWKYPLLNSPNSLSWKSYIFSKYLYLHIYIKPIYISSLSSQLREVAMRSL